MDPNLPEKDWLEAPARFVEGMRRASEKRAGETAYSQMPEHAVAYIDILGFSNLIRRMSSEPEIYNSVAKALEVFQLAEETNYSNPGRAENIVKGGFQPLMLCETVEMTAFSDSIVISDPHAITVILTVWELVRNLLQFGIFCRGAITLGKVHHKRRTIFGEGLIAAYEMEQKCAVYPRVLLSDSIAKKIFELEETSREAFGDTGTRFKDVILRDTDGLYFLNLFLESFRTSDTAQAKEAGSTHHQWLIKVSGKISHQLSILDDKTPSNMAALSKQRWLAGKFNEFLGNNKQYGLNPIDLRI